MPRLAWWETAGNNPLISHMFRTRGNFGPMRIEKLRVLTASSNTVGLNARGRHGQGSLLEPVTATSSTG